MDTLFPGFWAAVGSHRCLAKWSARRRTSRPAPASPAATRSGARRASPAGLSPLGFHYETKFILNYAHLYFKFHSQLGNLVSYCNPIGARLRQGCYRRLARDRLNRNQISFPMASNFGSQILRYRLKDTYFVVEVSGDTRSPVAVRPDVPGNYSALENVTLSLGSDLRWYYFPEPQIHQDR